MEPSQDFVEIEKYLSAIGVEFVDRSVLKALQTKTDNSLRIYIASPTNNPSEVEVSRSNDNFQKSSIANPQTELSCAVQASSLAALHASGINVPLEDKEKMNTIIDNNSKTAVSIRQKENLIRGEYMAFEDVISQVAETIGEEGNNNDNPFIYFIGDFFHMTETIIRSIERVLAGLQPHVRVAIIISQRSHDTVLLKRVNKDGSNSFILIDTLDTLQDDMQCTTMTTFTSIEQCLTNCCAYKMGYSSTGKFTIVIRQNPTDLSSANQPPPTPLAQQHSTSTNNNTPDTIPATSTTTNSTQINALGSKSNPSSNAVRSNPPSPLQTSTTTAAAQPTPPTPALSNAGSNNNNSLLQSPPPPPTTTTTTTSSSSSPIIVATLRNG